MSRNERQMKEEGERRWRWRRRVGLKLRGGNQEILMTRISCSMVVTDVTNEKQPTKRKREL